MICVTRMGALCVWAHFTYGRTRSLPYGWAHMQVPDGRTFTHAYGRTFAHMRMGALVDGRTFAHVWAHMQTPRQIRYGRTCEPRNGRTFRWAHTCKPSSRKPFVTVTLGSRQGDALFRHCDVMQARALALPRKNLRLGLDAILRGVL